VFVKTLKTAGTSIEVDLSRMLEPGAVVTPIYPPVDGHVPRNYMRPEGEFRNHMSAAEIRNLIGREAFDGMFRFCVEREPVRKCISHFHMLRNSRQHNPEGAYRASWSEYVATGDFPLDLDRYSEPVGGRRVLLVDRVLPYERLDDHLPPLLETLGLPGFRLVARAKSEYSRERHIEPQDVTPGERDAIYAAFAPTIAATGLYEA
jgi:hypothetical protein